MMELKDVKALCGGYGYYCNRHKAPPLGYPSVNPIHRQMREAKAYGNPGFIKRSIEYFDRWGKKRRTTVERPVKNFKQHRSYREPDFDDYMPAEYVLLYEILKHLRETKPEYFKVFHIHYVLYWQNGKKLNIFDKFKLSGFKKKAYYGRLNYVHDLVLRSYNDILNMEYHVDRGEKFVRDQVR